MWTTCAINLIYKIERAKMKNGTALTKKVWSESNRLGVPKRNGVLLNKDRTKNVYDYDLQNKLSIVLTN